MNEPTPKEPLDLAPIREQLNLPADAPEADIIAAMRHPIACPRWSHHASPRSW